MWSKPLSLCPEVRTHTGSTGKVSPGKEFPRSRAPRVAAALGQPHLCPQQGPNLPMSPASVTSLGTPRKPSGGWVQPQLLAVVPAITSSSREGTPAGKGSPGYLWIYHQTPHQRSTEGLQAQHLHSHALPAFPLCFVLLFTQQNPLWGLSTPKREAGRSGEGRGCLAPMPTGCPGAALEFGGRSCRFYCSSWVWFGL